MEKSGSNVKLYCNSKILCWDLYMITQNIFLIITAKLCVDIFNKTITYIASWNIQLCGTGQYLIICFTYGPLSTWKCYVSCSFRYDLRTIYLGTMVIATHTSGNALYALAECWYILQNHFTRCKFKHSSSVFTKGAFSTWLFHISCSFLGDLRTTPLWTMVTITQSLPIVLLSL